MACGSCGGKRQNVDYEVTLPDGSKTVVGSMSEVRVLKGQHQTAGGKAVMFRPIPRTAK